MPEQPQQQQMTPEQIEELKEKIKNMSPEELKEFQKKQCIFCHIVAGKVQAKKVYDDDKCLAILDINPANPGHILLLPKEHYSIMPQLPEDELEHIFMAAKALSNSVLRSLEASGTNILVANGPAAGQKAQHFMVHIIPRKEKDGIGFVLPQKTIAEKELEAIRKKVSGKLSELLGKPTETEAPSFVMPEAEPIESISPKLTGGKVVEAEFEEEKPRAKEKKVRANVAVPPMGKAINLTKSNLMPRPLQPPRRGKTGARKTKKPEKRIKPKEKKAGTKKEEKINLDDIANILGVK